MKKRFLTGLAAVLLICFIAVFFAAAEETDPTEFYYSLDRESKDELPGNLRFLTKDRYELKEPRHWPGGSSAPPYNPSTEGLDTLNISGSQQYGRLQFMKLAAEFEKLKTEKGINKVVIVDLRQEFHAFLNAAEESAAEGETAEENAASFVNGSSVSYTNRGNAPNLGINEGDQLRTAEVEHFKGLLNQEIAVRMRSFGGSRPPSGGSPGSWPSIEERTAAITLESYSTEQELAEETGFDYLRIAATDRLWPQPECIDEFIEYVKTLDMDKSWLHFHCLAGHGRTATFMVIYDIMKNPEVGLKDIVYRQYMAGDSVENLLRNDNKAEMIRLVYQYIQENRDDNYETPWSAWLANHNDLGNQTKAVLHLHNGQKVRIPGGGMVFSSNTEAVSVSGATLTAKRAGDSEVYVYGGTAEGLYRVEIWDDFKEIVFPENLTVVGNSAFLGDAHAVAVTLGTQVESVGEDAFSGTGALQITVTSEDTVFDPNVKVFGEEDKPVFLCAKDSSAAAYADENEYPYFYLAN